MARVATPRLDAAHLRMRVPRPSRRLAVIAVLALAVLIPFGLWLRDSSLVAVNHVRITGVSGTEAPEIRSALIGAADGMSTLHVDEGRLRDAVRRFAVVKDISVRGDFPHTLRISVNEHVPVGALASGVDRVAVAGDGTILADTSAVGLPLVPVSGAPGGAKVTGATARLVAVLGAAPPALRGRIARVTRTDRGLTVLLVRGPSLYFGTSTRLAAKWAAAVEILADQSSRGARYVDVRVPEHSAAGGPVPNAQ